VFGEDITPLVRAQLMFERVNFYSAAAAVAGRMFDNAGWDHAPGNDCVAWVKPAGAAELVYLQFGDGPDTYANPAVRQILANALRFTAAS
jgi:type 1 glutamine amidotransferase